MKIYHNVIQVVQKTIMKILIPYSVYLETNLMEIIFNDMQLNVYYNHNL